MASCAAWKTPWRCLGLERVDIVHLHDPDQHFRQALDEAFPTLDDLRSQGLIGAIGAGMHQWQMLAEFARHADFDCFIMAGRYTLLEQGSLPMLEICHEKGIAVFLGEVYNTNPGNGGDPGCSLQLQPRSAQHFGSRASDRASLRPI